MSKMVSEQTFSASMRVAVHKLKISKSSISRIKCKCMGLKAFEKLASPKYVKDQEAHAN